MKMLSLTTYRKCLAERSSDIRNINVAQQILDKLVAALPRLRFSSDRAAYITIKVHKVKIHLVLREFSASNVAYATASTVKEKREYIITVNFSRYMRGAGIPKRFKDYYDTENLSGLRRLVRNLLLSRSECQKWIIHEIVHITDFVRGYKYHSDERGYAEQPMEMNAYIAQELHQHALASMGSHNPLQAFGATPKEFIHKMWERLGNTGFWDGMTKDVWQRMIKRLYTVYPTALARFTRRLRTTGQSRNPLRAATAAP